MSSPYSRELRGARTLQAGEHLDDRGYTLQSSGEVLGVGAADDKDTEHQCDGSDGQDFHEPVGVVTRFHDARLGRRVLAAVPML